MKTALILEDGTEVLGLEGEDASRLRPGDGVSVYVSPFDKEHIKLYLIQSVVHQFVEGATKSLGTVMLVKQVSRAIELNAQFREMADAKK